jgi:transcriptional regulator with XRE-family HTH domain
MRLSAHFGARLAAIRVNRGLTLAELAALVGRAKPTIGRWEHGGLVEIHRSDVAKCAHILRCSRKVLLAPLDEPIPPAPSSWPRTLRRLKQHVAAVTGKRPRPYRRAATIPALSPNPSGVPASRPQSRPHKAPSAFERTLKLLPELTAAELALLLELKTAT